MLLLVIAEEAHSFGQLPALPEVVLQNVVVNSPQHSVICARGDQQHTLLRKSPGYGCQSDLAAPAGDKT